MSDINIFIPSFGDFLVYCKESGIERELFEEIFFEFLNNPNKYNNPEIIKNYLSDKLPIDSYIQLTSKLKI
jgi:hypothetical protein